MEYIPQLILLLLFIAFNGFFVSSEISLVKVRKTRIDELAKKNKNEAKLVQKALSDPSGFISATQLGITLVSLALGWIGEPIITSFVEKYFWFLPDHLSFIHLHTISIIIGFALLTFFQIVFGELVPKSIALRKAERVSLLNITPLMIFLTIFKPFIWILSSAANAIISILGISKTAGKSLHSQEEILMILSQSAAGGAIEKQEATMIAKVFQLGDLPIQAIMVPSSEIIGFNELSTIYEVAKKIEINTTHSRFPVYSYSIKKIIGYIHVLDIHRLLLENKKDQTLAESYIILPLVTVNEFMRVDDALMEMKTKKAHLMVVKNNSNQTVGIISIEDIIENLATDPQKD